MTITTTPWTYRQLTNAMNAAGWCSIGNGSYRHQDTGKIVNLYDWSQERGQLWQELAREHKTPEAR